MRKKQEKKYNKITFFKLLSIIKYALNVRFVGNIVYLYMIVSNKSLTLSNFEKSQEYIYIY